MPQSSSANSRSPIVWIGKPWILPVLLIRSIVMIVIAVVASWLEFMFDIAYKLIPYTEQIPIISNMSIFSWTVLVIFLVWLFSSLHFLLLWVSNTYLLRNDGLEIRVGIWTSKSFVVGSAGFADLQVIRSVSARILNFGDIIIRTQGETDVTIEKVKNPLKVADEIREVMAHPIVRIEGQEPSGDKK